MGGMSGDRGVGVRWFELVHSGGQELRTLSLTWPDALPLPTRGQLLETANGLVLEVTEISYYVGNGVPEPILLCKRDRG